MSYNDKSDVWALGCLLYEMCAFHPPFTANNQTELNRKIRIGDFPRIPAKYSSELDRIVRKMIKVEVCASRAELGFEVLVCVYVCVWGGVVCVGGMVGVGVGGVVCVCVCVCVHLLLLL